MLLNYFFGDVSKRDAILERAKILNKDQGCFRVIPLKRKIRIRVNILTVGLAMFSWLTKTRKNTSIDIFYLLILL